MVIVRRVGICGSVCVCFEGRWKRSSRSGALRIVGRWDFNCRDQSDTNNAVYVGHGCYGPTPNPEMANSLTIALIFALRRSEPLLNHSLLNCFLQSLSNLGLTVMSDTCSFLMDVGAQPLACLQIEIQYVLSSSWRCAPSIMLLVGFLLFRLKMMQLVRNIWPSVCFIIFIVTSLRSHTPSLVEPYCTASR